MYIFKFYGQYDNIHKQMTEGGAGHTDLKSSTTLARKGKTNSAAGCWENGTCGMHGRRQAASSHKTTRGRRCMDQAISRRVVGV